MVSFSPRAEAYPERSYIALMDLDFGFSLSDVDSVVEWWNQGVSYDKMAEGLGRDGDEIAVLLIDLVRQERIQKREGGCYGRSEVGV